MSNFKIQGDKISRAPPSDVHAWNNFQKVDLNINSPE